MTMMALTRRRHRALHLWLLLLGLLLVGAVALGVRSSGVSAIAEGDVQFSVTQTPAGGSTVQAGSAVIFDVAATVTNAPVALPVHFEFDYPAGLSFLSGASTPAGVTCIDNTPGFGKVRCSYGLVGTGPRLPVQMVFTVTSTTATTASQVMVVAGDSDGGPDTAVDGSDDSFATAGTLTVFNSSNFAVGGGGAASMVFEGAASSYSATITNHSGVGTGAFNASVSLTGAVVNGAACTTTGPNGSASGGGTTASCTGSGLANGETLSITAFYVAANTASGDDITAHISAAGLGISQAGNFVAVDELGLDFTGSTLAAGTPVNVCTAPVPSDVANDAAAGSAQPGNGSLVGSSSLATLLTTNDFQVSGPGVGAVTAASGCGANQSGVSFTPSASGSYTVTATYNVGGANTLALSVAGGSASNPVPSAGSLFPSSANAGSAGFTLTVLGSSFVPASVVRWNGSPLATTYLGATTLEASVPAANILSPGSASVTVFSPTPGGGASNSLTFAINNAPNPVPTVSALSPDTTGAGVAQFQVTVTGTNFVAGSVVRWNGADLATSYSSSSSLIATVPAANVATAGAANVTVFNPAPGGGASVTPQTFTITPGAAKLAFTTQPGAGVAGSALGAQPVVAVQSASNVTITGDSTTVVTLALTGTGTLTCTGGLSKTVAAGVATFAGCAVSAAGPAFTITAAASGLTSATSGAFDVTDVPPTSSSEVVVTNSSTAFIPRSRLSFGITTGNLTGTAVSFIIRRDPDDRYWNAATSEWQESLVLNSATQGTGNAWRLEILGEDRREFVNTTVTLEARVTVSTTVYVNATIPELDIR